MRCFGVLGVWGLATLNFLLGGVAMGGLPNHLNPSLPQRDAFFTQTCLFPNRLALPPVVQPPTSSIKLSCPYCRSFNSVGSSRSILAIPSAHSFRTLTTPRSSKCRKTTLMSAFAIYSFLYSSSVLSNLTRKPNGALWLVLLCPSRKPPLAQTLGSLRCRWA